MLNLFRARANSPYTVVFGICRTKVNIVVVENANSQPSLVVSDECAVSGDDIAAAMRKLSHDYQKYCRHHPRLALVLGAGLYQSVTLERPQLSDAELSASLRYQLSDLVTFDTEDCIADYYELPTQVQGQHKIHAIATSRKQLEPLLQVAHELSDQLQGVFAEEQALATVLENLNEPAALVYQQPHQAALVQVYNNGELQVNRAVRSLEKLSELSIEEIRMGGLQPLSVEIQRSADYFERQLRQRPVASVYLALPLPKQQEVLERLHEDLGFEIAWATYPSWAQELATGDYSDFPALGGALLAQQNDAQEASS